MSILAIDNILVTFLKKNCYRNLKDVKNISLIGELSKEETSDSLRKKIEDIFGFPIDVYTAKHKFDFSKQYETDLLVSCRGCEAEEPTIKYAVENNLKYVVLLCACNSVHKKAKEYIKKYDSNVWIKPQHEHIAWYVLHNLNFFTD